MHPIAIPKRARQCAHQQEPLEPGMDYYSLVIEEGGHTYRRQDYCLECWEVIPRVTLFEEYRVHWKSHVPLKPEKAELPKERCERALLLFHEAYRNEAEEELFVLAQYLQRIKRFAFRKEFTHPSGIQYLLYEQLDTEEMFPIKKVAIETIDVSKVQEQIAQGLRVDVPAP